MNYFQYLIYNNDFTNDEGEGTVQVVSNLYTNKSDCEQAALDCINDFCEENDADPCSQDTWQYEITEVSVVK